MNANRPGYFVFSLDTELAWGFFDYDERRSRLFSQDGSRERRSIHRILSIFEEFGIAGTWAVVGHMLADHQTECPACPAAGWEGRHRAFEQINTRRHPLWYGPDVIGAIRGCEGQEIGFHGYTHAVFGEDVMSGEEARAEIDCWLEAGQRVGLRPVSVVFPRNRVGHLDAFREAGFTSYRDDAELPWLTRNRYFGGPLKSADHVLALSTPPIYGLDEMVDEAHELVVHRPSQHLFGFNRGVETWLDERGMALLRVRRVVRGVRQAAEQGKVFHLWAHPWEFRTEDDFAKLRYILQAVSEEVEQGRLIPIGMSDLAAIVNEQTHAPGGRRSA